MNNEEKILAMLESLTGKVDGIETDITSMKTDITSMKTDIKDIKGRVTNVELTIENKVYPMIQAIREGQIINREKLAEVDATVDDMASTVLALDVLHIRKPKPMKKIKQN